jgi:hypothetical protein
MLGARLVTEFSPLTAKGKSGMMKLSLAILLMTVILGPNAGQTQSNKSEPTKADALYTVRVLNRSTTKLQVTVWDENQARKVLLSTTMAAGAELPVKALAKIAPEIREHGPGTHVSWKVVALDDKGFPLKPGVKPPTRCGKFLSFKDNERVEIGPYENVPGAAC